MSVVVDLLRQDGLMLEYARIAVAADDLSRGVDLFRRRPNDTSLIQGRLVTNQIWQRITFHLDPQSSVGIALNVGFDAFGFHQGTQRLDRPRLIKAGSVVRSFVRDPEASQLSLASLEIFGWEVSDAWLPEVEGALRAMNP